MFSSSGCEREGPSKHRSTSTGDVWRSLVYTVGGKGAGPGALREGRAGHRGPGKPCEELQHALEIEDVIEGLKQVSAETRRGV